MTDSAAAAVNQAIQEASPALFDLLSPLGKRVVFPNDIPFQAAQARGKTFNATIGQITDGANIPIPVTSVMKGLSGLAESYRNPAVLYSPGLGFPSLRQAWRAWHRRNVNEGIRSTLPMVTVGLSHGLSILADLFSGPGRAVVLPQPFWGNYRHCFELRTGARLVPAPSVVDGNFQPEAIADALATLEEGEPAVAVLNFPSNPGGYTPNRDERSRVLSSLLRAADRNPFVVICDDAYAGLYYEEETPRESYFWDLVDQHPNLIPVKVDGATKEVSFFGGRVGFLTFPFEPGSEAEEALENKVQCLLQGCSGFTGGRQSEGPRISLGLTDPARRDRERSCCVGQALSDPQVGSSRDVS